MNSRRLTIHESSLASVLGCPFALERSDEPLCLRFHRCPGYRLPGVESAGARSAVLLHGWPDSPHAWKDLAQSLADAGYRVLAPALRGFAPTRFRDASTAQRATGGSGLRSAGIRRRPGIATSLLVGHDWGARAVASACGLREGFASHLVMLSVGYASNDPQQVLSLPQARSFWYQWFMATPRGERALREEGEAFARQMWDTWSPPGWYAERDFQEAAQAFSGPDWVAVVLHYYRHRWGFVAGSRATGGGTALAPGTAPGAADPGAARRRGCLHPPRRLPRTRALLQRALPAAGAGGRRPFSAARGGQSGGGRYPAVLRG